MNNSINYSGFVDMLLNSDGDFEPYGYSIPPQMPAQSSGLNPANRITHHDNIVDDPREE